MNLCKFGAGLLYLSKNNNVFKGKPRQISNLAKSRMSLQQSEERSFIAKAELCILVKEGGVANLQNLILLL